MLNKTPFSLDNYSFAGYAFNIALNGLSVAIYKNEKGGAICRVEKDGEIVEEYTEMNYSAKHCPDGVEWKLVEDFVSNEDDKVYNKARALSEVLEGMYIGDLSD